MILNMRKVREGKVYQSNALVKSRQNFNMMQKRLFYIAMESVRRSDADFKELILPVPALRELVGGYYGSFKDKLREASVPLVGTTLSIHRASGSWASISIFQTIEYLNAGETSESGFKNVHSFDVLRMKLHDDLKAYLLKLESNFNNLAFNYVLSFNYTRSHKLFELLHHESWAGEHHKVSFDRDDLTSYLEMEGSYAKFRDYRRALDRLCEQIHEVTPMRVSYEGKRVGRGIKQIEFTIHYAKDVALQGSIVGPADPDKTLEEIELGNVLRQLGYSQDPFPLFDEYGLDRVQEAVKVTRAVVKSAPPNKPIHNPGGFIVHILKHGGAETFVNTADEVKPVAGDAKVQLEVLEVKYSQARDEAVEQLIEQHGVALLLDGFEMYLSKANEWLLDFLKGKAREKKKAFDIKDWFRDAAAYVHFKDFVAAQHLPKRLQSFEAWQQALSGGEDEQVEDS